MPWQSCDMIVIIAMKIGHCIFVCHSMVCYCAILWSNLRGEIWSTDWTNDRHPISCPFGWCMGYLFSEFKKKNYHVIMKSHYSTTDIALIPDIARSSAALMLTVFIGIEFWLYYKYCWWLAKYHYLVIYGHGATVTPFRDVWYPMTWGLFGWHIVHKFGHG